MTRDEIAGRTAAYASAIQAPVVTGTAVERLTDEDGAGGSRFRVETSRGTSLATDVVVATGAFHSPRIPETARFGARITQLHAHEYRNPDALPEGGVLVIGTGQTGVQLAEELQAAGRKVVLSVGHCWRAPRRYRGHDYFWSVTGKPSGRRSPRSTRSRIRG
jgi:putative flavoprotein involved in K+ transport